MVRLTQRDLRRLLAALRQLYASADLEAFPGRVLATLPHVVASDMTGYNEVNLKQGRVTGRIEPSAGDVEVVLREFARHMHEHPVLAYIQRTGDGSARKISDFLTQRQFHQLGLYREFYRPLGIEHQMAISLPAVPSLVIGIAFNRGRPDFSERDRLLLNLLRPHVVQARANAEAMTRLKQQSGRDGRDDGAIGVIVLDEDGRVRGWTESARRWIAEYFGKLGEGRRLPDRLERWVTHQRSWFSQASDPPPPRSALVVERVGKRLVVRLLSEPIGDQHVVLLEEQRAAVALAALEPFGLTRREADVLRWVAQGKTNAEVGTILGLSPLTVRTHLEHIFQKLGVETRTAAAVRALEAVESLPR